MAATVTPIRPPGLTRLLAMPMWDREARKAAVEELAADCQSPMRTEAQVRAFAHPSLGGAAAMRAWRDLLAERERLDAVEARELDWRELDPATAQEDYDCALADLLDGNDTYHGDRSGERSKWTR